MTVSDRPAEQRTGQAFPSSGGHEYEDYCQHEATIRSHHLFLPWSRRLPPSGGSGSWAT